MTDISNMSDEELGQYIEDNSRGVPSSAVVKGSAGFAQQLAAASANMSLSGLSPAMRAPIVEKLQNVPPSMRESEEKRLIQEALQSNSLSYRMRAGVSEEADAYTKERFAIAREGLDLEDQMNRIINELAAVDGYDPATGDAIMRVTGLRREGLTNELQRLDYQQRLLLGPEREKRLAEAKQTAIANYRERAQRIADAAEVDRRADEMVREERIQKQAEAKASWKRSSL